MNIEPIHWQIAVSLIGVGVQLLIAERSKRQTQKHTESALDVQRLVSHRSVASVIADKRQKWIDELRIDMAFHLAQSKEIVWKWGSIRSRTALEVQEKAKDDQAKKEILQDAADVFSPENGQRDREHEERHIRIKFRLNPKEDLHIELRKCLDGIRIVLDKNQGAKNESESKRLIGEIIDLVNNATKLTEKVLKAEWERLKQEVAYPDALMATIPEPKNK